MAEPRVVQGRAHEKVLIRDLTRGLTVLTPGIFDEISTAIDEEWSVNTQEWTEINPYETLINIVARASNRVFLGLPLCRDKSLIRNAIAFASSVVPCAFLIRKIPEPFRPFGAPLITLWNKQYRRNLANIIRPEVHKRLAQLNTNPNSATASAPMTIHNDFLQWTIEAALDNPGDLDPEIVIQHMGLVNFAAIHTATVTATLALFELISQPELITSVLREEINEVMAKNDNTWSKHAVSRLVKLDSALRESSRMSPLSAILIARYVLPKDGITTPLSGTYLPCGSNVAVPSLAIHKDPTRYDKPEIYEPFRFVDAAKENDTRAVPLSTTSSNLVAFGAGRHSCPGRFFASLELKLIFAYLIQKYDFEYLEKPPERIWAGSVNMPPAKQTIRVKRKE